MVRGDRNKKIVAGGLGTRALIHRQGFLCLIAGYGALKFFLIGLANTPERGFVFVATGEYSYRIASPIARGG